ncbi:hypothetical protein DPMN_131362 [Dreissena polymorpha]|uniref:Uncharacterized protein n=1 Tax=Dreissena polymorpha TaxID=45954 RepID=A0A9D4H4G4_DREPO|nr:hypothetical protein DPMN_131362 [Dreissena polymorpha]
MLAHVDGGGVFRQAGKRRGEMRTDVESALASGLWGTWGLATPTPARPLARLSREVQRAAK